MAAPKSNSKQQGKSAVVDEPGGKDAVKAQEETVSPEDKVSQTVADGTPQDAKALENKPKAEAQHPDEAPADKDGSSGAIDKDAPKPIVGETDKEPENPTERAQMEAAPVGVPDTTGVAPAAVDSDSVPLDPPTEKSSLGSDAPIAAGLASGDLDDIAVGVGLRSNNGERTGGIVDEDGNPVNFEDVVDMGDGSMTNVVVTKRVYETFYLPGSFRPLTRLLYADGATITRNTAAKVIEASKAVQEA